MFFLSTIRIFQTDPKLWTVAYFLNFFSLQLYCIFLLVSSHIFSLCFLTVQISTLTLASPVPHLVSTTLFFTCFNFPSPRCCSEFGPVRGELQREAGAGWRGRMWPLCSPGMCVFVTNRKKRESGESEADQILLQVFHKQHNSANRFPSPLSLCCISLQLYISASPLVD